LKLKENMPAGTKKWQGKRKKNEKRMVVCCSGSLGPSGPHGAAACDPSTVGSGQ